MSRWSFPAAQEARAPPVDELAESRTEADRDPPWRRLRARRVVDHRTSATDALSRGLRELLAPRRLLIALLGGLVSRRPGAGLLYVGQEVGPVDQLHREKDPVVVGDHELVQLDEVPMVNVGERSKLLLEEIESARARVEKGLQGDVLLPFAVERLVDDAHAAAADAAEDLVTRGSLPALVEPRAAGPGIDVQS